MAARKRLSPRSVFAGLCGTIGVLVLLAGSFLSLGSRILFDSDYFAAKVADSLSDPRTASYVADQVTNAVVEANTDLILVRPLVQTAAQTMVSSGPFRAIAKEAVKRSHQLMVSEGGRNVLLSVSDFGLILSEALGGHPEIAQMIPIDAVAVMGEFQEWHLMEVSDEAISLGHRVGKWPQRIFLVGILFIVAGVLLASDRELALLRSGISVTAIAALILLTFELGTYTVERFARDPALGAALAGVLDAFLGGLRFRVAVVGATGLLMAATATAFLETMKLEVVGNRLWRFLTVPFENRWMRLARGLVYLLVGAFIILETDLATRIFFDFAGWVFAFFGMRELSRLAVDPAERLARKIENLEDQARAGRSWVRHSIIALGVGALLIPTAWLFSRGPEDSGTPLVIESEDCNGSSDLCDLPLDQVVFAGTHNAMGSADVDGWLFPNQQHGIRRQLEDGIRAFMLDVHPGYQVNNFVKTDLGENEVSRDKLEPILGTEGLNAALRIRERLVEGDAQDRDLFLCHGLCEIGAQRLVPVLEVYREFLIAHPGEVIIIIIEDYVSPESVAAAFEESGLLSLVYRGEVTPPWPTLGEMADQGGRVLVLGEKNTAGVPWYHSAWEVFQESPYHFTSAEEFDCAPNRGGTDGPLLLVNHWVTTPPTSRPSDAAIVNARDALMERLDECREVRGRYPNVIAVDFYGVGDLVEVVGELNRGP